MRNSADYMREYMRAYRRRQWRIVAAASERYEATHKHVRAAYRRRMGMKPATRKAA